MAPDRNVVPIPKGMGPENALQAFLSPLMKYYESIRNLALDFYEKVGHITPAFFDKLQDDLMDAGWTLMYQKELSVDVLTDKMVKRLKEPLRLLNLGLSTEISIQQQPSQFLGEISIAEFLQANTARQVLRNMQESVDRRVSERTYSDLHSSSDSGRKGRSSNVYVRPPKAITDAYGNDVLEYSFKSQNSTTGNRQTGYIRFLGGGEETSDVEVFCSCPDYKFRYEHVNWKDGSASEPKDPKTKAFPIKTNPSGDIGLCKHLLAASKYVDGMEII
jgi:hypothetical protein